MTPSERRRAHDRARAAAARQRTRIIDDTRREILAQLAEAERQILALLAAQPDDATRWQLAALQREVRRAMEEFTRDSGPIGARGLESAWAGGAALIDGPLTAAGIAIEGVQSIDPQALVAMREFLTEKIRDISVAAANRINTQLGLTILGAQSPFDAVRQVQQILGEQTRARAVVIVRTELNRAFGAAAHARLAQLADRVPGMRKQWRRSGKANSRHEHDAADGQTVGWDESFTFSAKTGKYTLRYPVDPQGPPQGTINCGCTMLPVLPDDLGLVPTTPRKKPFTAQELARSQFRSDLADAMPLQQALRDRGRNGPGN